MEVALEKEDIQEEVEEETKTKGKPKAVKPATNRRVEFDPVKFLRKLGKGDYLDVKFRLLWLTIEEPYYQIETEPVLIEDRKARFKATVTTYEDAGWTRIKRRTTGYGSETVGDFGDFAEKAETKAIGRALAAIGYGAQFVGEDDGERPVDAPTELPKVSFGLAPGVSL